MLNSLETVREYWSADVFGLDSAVFDSFLQRECDNAFRRLARWVGRAAIDDAALETPADQDRADALRSAEIELIHIQMINQLWRDKCAGQERDIQFPSGMRITLQAFTAEDCTALISDHVSRAENMALEYLV